MLRSCFAMATGPPALAQQPPPTATTKVTDNDYIVRYVRHQSMFIVTPDGEGGARRA
jgi:hypothetical protein